MIQKVIRVGNSAGVTLPQQLLQAAGLRVGDAIEVVASKEPEKIEIMPARKKLLRKASGITPEFVASVDSFIHKYKHVLEELAKR